MLNKKKKFNKEIVKQVIKIIFLKFELIMILRLFEGKKPPLEIKDMLRLSELNNLIPVTLNKKNIKILNAE
tara:strand:+ start:586 stop:798 length:213 start_codon:yes stop_codon:yes gene_type:complete